MKNPTKFLTLIAVVLLFISSIVSCSEKTPTSVETITESRFDLATAKTEIEAANKELIALLVKADSEGISKCFTKDAKFMMSGTPSISGMKNIQSTFSGLIKSGITNLDLKTTEVWGAEYLITEEGMFSLFAGETKVDYGKFIVLWKKEEGKWKLHRDMISSDKPLAV